MSPTQPLPPKKDVALALLEKSSIYVHLDPRQPAVVVPNWFKKQPQLVLQVGLDMAVKIPDLRLDDDGMSCTLSFNRAPFFCVVPWTSVFAMVGDDGRGMVWPDDVPAEVARHAQTRGLDASVLKEPPRTAAVAREVKAEASKAKRPRKRPALAAVADAGSQDGAVKPVKAMRAAAERPARAGQSNSQRPAVGPAPAPQQAQGAPRKRKKELPPYLRVVK
jgi:stringent starvation protein B